MLKKLLCAVIILSFSTVTFAEPAAETEQPLTVAADTTPTPETAAEPPAETPSADAPAAEEPTPSPADTPAPAEPAAEPAAAPEPEPAPAPSKAAESAPQKAPEPAALKPEEDRIPPQIIHTVGAPAREGRSYAVRTTIRENGAVKDAILYARSKDAGTDYVQLPMLKVEEGVYEAIVPSNIVRGSTLQYYLGVTDSAGNSSMDGDTEAPYEVKIIPLDKEAPSISHTPVTSGTDAADITINAKVADNASSLSVNLYYRPANETVFEKDSAGPFPSHGAPVSFAIPASAVTTGTMEYYLEAVDQAGNKSYAGAADKTFSIAIVRLMPYSDGLIIERKEGSKDALINLGSTAGLKKGDVLHVIRADEKVIDPKTQEILNIKQVLVGKLKVNAVSAKSSTAEIVSEIAPEKAASGQLLRLRCGPVNGLQTGAPKIRAVDLSWEASREPEAAGYAIYRAEAADGKYTRIAEVKGGEKFTDADAKNPLKDEATYFYKVAAVNGEKMDGVLSDPIAATTKGGPNPPAGFQASSNEIRQITFNWPKPSDADTDGYIIQKADKEEGPFANLFAVKRAADIQAVVKATKEAPLEDGQSYWFRLAAVNKVGKAGTPTAPVMAATRQKPAAPAAPSVSKEFVRSITIAWEQHPDKEIAGYIVYRQDKAGAEFKKIGETKDRATATFLDKGLADSTSYSYQVSAMLKGGLESLPSASVTATTFGPPETPEGLTASEGKFREVSLNWTPVKKEEIGGYEIFRSADGKKFDSIKKLTGRDNAAFSDKGDMFTKLLDGKQYYYKIQSFNVADVPSKQTEPAKGTTKPLPVKPAGLAGASGEVKQTSLTWDANAEKDIKEYIVYRSNSADKGYSASGTSKTSSLTVGKLEDGTTYWFRVSAKDADGLESEQSNAVSIATKPLPGAPGAPKASAAETEVSLEWSASPATDVVKYNVYEKGFFGGTLAGTVTTLNHTIKGVKPDKSYSYYVTAVDATGLESKPSGTVEVKTPKAPGKE